MNCRYCGTPIEEGDYFCTNCGRQAVEIAKGKKKKNIMVIAAIAVVLVIVGILWIGSRNPIVGSWKMNVGNQEVIYTFDKGGTGVVEITGMSLNSQLPDGGQVPFAYTLKNGYLEVNVEGQKSEKYRYETKGSALILINTENEEETVTLKKISK